MFAFEDLSQMISLMQRQIHMLLVGNLCFYLRLTLVALLHLAKSQVLTDWVKCVDVLLQKIENDRSLILSSNILQELYIHLHLSELWENPALEMNPRAAAAAFGMSRPVTGKRVSYSIMISHLWFMWSLLCLEASLVSLMSH